MKVIKNERKIVKDAERRRSNVKKNYTHKPETISGKIKASRYGRKQGGKLVTYIIVFR